jgi:hypothetical protein
MLWGWSKNRFHQFISDMVSVYQNVSTEIQEACDRYAQICPALIGDAA